MQDKYIAVCELNNEIEAQMIEVILEENAIPHMLHLSDSVALPVYDIVSGYAVLYADEEYAEEIRELVEEMREDAVEPDNEYDEYDDGDSDDISSEME